MQARSGAPVEVQEGVRIQAANGATRDDGWVRIASRPSAARIGEGLLLALGGTAVGILLLPIPLVHLFGIMFALSTWWLGFRRATTARVVAGAGGTCPRCGKTGNFFVGFGRKRYGFPIATSCPHCAHRLALEAPGPAASARP